MRHWELIQDDRLFRLEISTHSDLKDHPWAVVTLHNVAGRIPAREDHFASRETALNYYLKVVVETPRASLGNHSPDPLPSIEQYTTWLKSQNLHDAVLNNIDG
jgi:hypothetical protein